MIDCIVNLPTKLFLNTGIPACIWLLSRNKRKRKNEILFIDARFLGILKTRKNLEFSDQDVGKVADTYHNWKSGNGAYEDLQGFCKSVNVEEVRALNYVVSPGRFVGLPDDEDNFDFEERLTSLKSELVKQLKEEASLNEILLSSISKLKING